MPLLTVDQAAERLGTSPRFTRRLIAERRIAFAKLRKHVRIDSADLDAFVAAGRVAPAGSVALPESRDGTNPVARVLRGAARSALINAPLHPGRCAALPAPPSGPGGAPLGKPPRPRRGDVSPRISRASVSGVSARANARA
jgi:excisionase family DNA binding protein